MAKRDYESFVRYGIPADGAGELEPLHPEAAVVEAGLVRLLGNCHVQVQLFQRPRVRLSTYNHGRLKRSRTDVTYRNYLYRQIQRYNTTSPEWTYVKHINEL
jgi:hypothetical protein